MAGRYFLETRFGEDPPKRHKIVRWRGFDGYWARWTDACSGCSEDAEYTISDVGSGCHECGYTGKRRRAWFVPLDIEAWERWRERVYKRYTRLRERWRAAA